VFAIVGFGFGFGLGFFIISHKQEKQTGDKEKMALMTLCG
jgi:hypothetical protein